MPAAGCAGLRPRGVVAPLDKETILASLAKTNRLLIAHEAVTDFGIGAEIAALAAWRWPESDLALVRRPLGHVSDVGLEIHQTT